MPKILPTPLRRISMPKEINIDRGAAHTMVGVQSVFVSSVQRDYGEIRASVRRAIEILHMHPLMAESVGARPESPQRALLDLVAQSDVLLLIIGARYSKPTEDEFNEANRLGRPILVLKQNVELEPEQEAFVERVAGGWVGGRHRVSFDDENDVLTVAVEALSALNTGQRRAELAPAAQERARMLASAERRQGYAGHRSSARVTFVPLLATPLLDALALDDTLGNAVADLARAERLVPHSVGVAPIVTSEGVSLERASGGYAGEDGFITVGVDGAIVCEVDVGGDGQLAGTRVDSGLLAGGIQSAGAFALRVWERIDGREEVQQVAVAVAVLDAQYKVFDLPPNATSYSMGMSMPSTVVVPEPPSLVRRAEIGGDQLAKRLVAEVRRAFADAGAVAN
jgi:hypothetical protein